MSASAPIVQGSPLGQTVGEFPAASPRATQPPIGPGPQDLDPIPRYTEYVPRVIAVTTPAAGAEFSQRVTGGAVWILHSVRAQLVTSAVVANRFPRLTLSDGTTTWATLPTSVAITASLTVPVEWLPDPGGVGSTAGGVTGPLPSWPCVLPPGTVISSSTAAIDAGDQYSAVGLYCYEITTEPYGTDWIRTERGMDLLARMRF